MKTLTTAKLKARIINATEITSERFNEELYNPYAVVREYMVHGKLESFQVVEVYKSGILDLICIKHISHTGTKIYATLGA